MSKASKRIRELCHSMPMADAISFATVEQLERIADALENQSAGKITINGSMLTDAVMKAAHRPEKVQTTLLRVDLP